MKIEKLFDAMDLISQDYKEEALEAMNKKNKDARRGMKTPVRIMLIAAVIASLFVGTTFAVGNYINSPEQAEKVARAELKKMQDMGLLSDDFYVSDAPADRVIELPTYDAETHYFGRIWPHRYSVQWFKGSETGGYPYTIVTQIDTSSGSIMAVTIEAAAGEDDVPYRESVEEIPVGWDEEKQQPITEMMTFKYYDNYEDIIPEGMTVDSLCALLNEYWGFKGYTIVDTVDDFYELDDVQTPSGDSLVRDLPQDNYYLSVLFEGDQAGVPRYIQTAEFNGYVSVIIGMNHAVG